MNTIVLANWPLKGSVTDPQKYDFDVQTNQVILHLDKKSGEPTNHKVKLNDIFESEDKSYHVSFVLHEKLKNKKNLFLIHNYVITLNSPIKDEKYTVRIPSEELDTIEKRYKRRIKKQTTIAIAEKKPAQKTVHFVLLKWPIEKGYAMWTRGYTFDKHKKTLQVMVPLRKDHPNKIRLDSVFVDTESDRNLDGTWYNIEFTLSSERIQEIYETSKENETIIISEYTISEQDYENDAFNAEHFHSNIQITKEEYDIQSTKEIDEKIQKRIRDNEKNLFKARVKNIFNFFQKKRLNIVFVQWPLQESDDISSIVYDMEYNAHLKRKTADLNTLVRMPHIIEMDYKRRMILIHLNKFVQVNNQWHNLCFEIHANVLQRYANKQINVICVQRIFYDVYLRDYGQESCRISQDGDWQEVFIENNKIRMIVNSDGEFEEDEVEEDVIYR